MCQYIHPGPSVRRQSVLKWQDTGESFGLPSGLFSCLDKYLPPTRWMPTKATVRKAISDVGIMQDSHDNIWLHQHMDWDHGVMFTTPDWL